MVKKVVLSQAENAFLLSPNKRDAHEPFVLTVAVSCPRCRLEIAGVVEKPKDGADVAETVRGCVERLRAHYCDPDGMRRGRPQKRPVVEQPAPATPEKRAVGPHVIEVVDAGVQGEPDANGKEFQARVFNATCTACGLGAHITVDVLLLKDAPDEAAVLRKEVDAQLAVVAEFPCRPVPSSPR